MFKSYLTVAIRNLTKYKMYSFINVMGLSLGMAAVILVLLFVRHEFLFDQHYEKNVYRVVRVLYADTDARVATEGTPGALAGTLEREMPEVEHAVRAWTMDNVWVSRGKKSSIQEFCLADVEILDLFDYELVHGDRATVLTKPNAIVLTESMVEKYFAGEDPIGKVITPEGRYFGGVDYTVTGVMKDIPVHSTLRFDFLTATPMKRSIVASPWERWKKGTGWFPVQTFVLLSPGAVPEAVAEKIPDLVETHFGAEARAETDFYLQPVDQMHLYSKRDFNFSTRIPDGVRYGQKTYGDIDTVSLFVSISAFVLLLACVNFVNLSTAKSMQRAKEVGVRKVVGAQRRQLMLQFLSEAVLLSGIALCVALVLAWLALPVVNGWAGKTIAFSGGGWIPVLGTILGFVFVVGALAGSYPAFFLSAFQPIVVLKGISQAKSKGAGLRKGLVVFQFAISMVMIVSAYVVHDQLTFMMDTDLGFNKERVILLPVFAVERQIQTNFEGELTRKYNVVKQEFLQHPDIEKVTACHRFGPFGASTTLSRVTEPVQKEVEMSFMGIDEDFLDFYEMELVAGRNFVRDNEYDLHKAALINETAAKWFGWDDPVGKTFKGNHIRTVVGVVKDFHNGSLRDEIRPMFMMMWRSKFNYISVKVKTDDLAGVMTFLKNKWRQFLPNQPFTYHFADARFDQMYRSEMQMRQFFSVASWLTVFVACLGLWGLASFVIAQRMKEVGVRRVLGASMVQIVMLFCKDFAKWIGVAVVIACPVIYYVMGDWLQGFAYRIDLGVSPFLLGACLTLAIALGTVGYQAFRAGMSNPVDTLRSE